MHVQHWLADEPNEPEGAYRQIALSSLRPISFHQPENG
jgi:hypothetical protein